jgi:hypothetical protein
MGAAREESVGCGTPGGAHGRMNWTAPEAAGIDARHNGHADLLRQGIDGATGIPREPGTGASALTRVRATVAAVPRA